MDVFPHIDLAVFHLHVSVCPYVQYCIWTDGLCALLGREMGSDLTRSDLDTLISMEMKLRLLDLENITIPEAPPPVPKEPSSYNFTYNYSWDVCVRACVRVCNACMCLSRTNMLNFLMNLANMWKRLIFFIFFFKHFRTLEAFTCLWRWIGKICFIAW